MTTDNNGMTDDLRAELSNGVRAAGHPDFVVDTVWEGLEPETRDRLVSMPTPRPPTCSRTRSGTSSWPA
jgi:hypothetical protein